MSYFVIQRNNWEFPIFNFNQTNRGDFTRLRKGCLRLNAMDAGEKPRYLSSLESADPFTAEPVSLNAGQTDRERLNWTSVLTRRMHGHDEEKVLQAKGKSNQIAFFKDKWNTRKHYCFFQLFVIFMYVQFNKKGKRLRGTWENPKLERGYLASVTLTKREMTRETSPLRHKLTLSRS